VTQQTRSINKSRFEDGDSLSGSNFADLVDSYLSLADTTAQVITSDVQTPRLIATTEVSTPTLNVTDVNASVLNATRVSAAGIITHGYVSASAARIPLLDGPVQVGTNSKNRGRVVLCQQVTLTPTNSVNATVARLPSGSDILDIQYYVTNAYSTVGASGNTNVCQVRVGNSATETAFGTVDVSARGRYRVAQGVFTSAGTSWLALNSANSRIMAQVTALDDGGHSAAAGVLSITYLQK